ncbi:TPA: glycerophosphoryl diester phosphodiesterase [Staphylococcus aureus]|nr:glycerophosphoryl diester phosphodiesterase [Staphylococcus aureus]HCV7995835.1 glycerophosphoryl diester phosphodiesterase [Staphylococcus aureus]HDE4211808.1 glycerophosphoryl diester phosphodiesterase [Staphylococcus aureus]HDE4213694.1 glycerophosphoryl diester phosphodiesterase [Staphylococcus aureus]
MLTVYGHRGLPSKAPENTIASFKAASEVEGINWLELDVAITKDEHLPTFDDVVKIANEYNMNLNVELKGITGPNGLALSKSMVKQVEEQLTNLNQNQEVLISSFNVVLVKLAEEIMPQYNRAVIFHTTSFREDWRTLLDYCNAKIVNTEDAKLTKAKVKMVKEAGYELNVWTVNKPARANQLANWGVDGIFTDNADKMVHLSQ